MDKKNTIRPEYDVVIIGAGPSGACAAALLRQRGFSVCILEKQHFPRFVIGESLLSHCISFFEEAKFLPVLQKHADELAFQKKIGAFFIKGDMTNFFDFRDKFTPGPAETWQVKRGVFDKVLADEAAKQGTDIYYGQSVKKVDISGEYPVLTVMKENSTEYQVTGRFLLDASGYGRVLPRLLDLEFPSDLPVRRAIFSHIEDRISDPSYDRDKIVIAVHDFDDKAWFWLIPFSDGRCSLGIVAGLDFFAQFEDINANQCDLKDIFLRILKADSNMSKLLENANFDMAFQEIKNYSANVKRLFGKHFAILGNAGEFLDPVFSSGVTIALKSASIVVPLVARELSGESVDWLEEYENPLRAGINIFRVYVDGWYDGTFQDVVFAKYQKADIKKMICSLLAGYAWDSSNPMYADAKRKLATLAELCRDTSHD